MEGKIGIYVAGSMSASGVDAEDVVGDDVTVSGSAIGSRDGRSSHLIEDRRNTLERPIGGFTCSYQ